METEVSGTIDRNVKVEIAERVGRLALVGWHDLTLGTNKSVGIF